MPTPCSDRSFLRRSNSRLIIRMNFWIFLRLIEQEAIGHMRQLSQGVPDHWFRNPAGTWSDFLGAFAWGPDPLQLSGGKWSFLYLDFRKVRIFPSLTDRWRQLLALRLRDIGYPDQDAWSCPFLPKPRSARPCPTHPA